MSLWTGGCLHPARPANARCEGCLAGDPYWEPPPTCPEDDEWPVGAVDDAPAADLPPKPPR